LATNNSFAIATMQYRAMEANMWASIAKRPLTNSATMPLAISFVSMEEIVIPTMSKYRRLGYQQKKKRRRRMETWKPSMFVAH
jgi:hypothetical protein